MIIATSQEFAAVDCCGCLPLECGAPRKECKSITITPCGFNIVSYSDAANPADPNDICGYWQTQELDYVIDTPSSTVDYGSWTGTYQRNEHHNRLKYVETDGLSCLSKKTVNNSDHSYSKRVNNDAPYDITEDETRDLDSVYTDAGGCVGTDVLVDNVTPANSHSLPWNVCDEHDFWGDEYTHSIVGDTVVFEQHAGDESSTIDLVVTFSNRVTFDSLTARLDELDFDEHSNGDGCSSLIIGQNGCVGFPEEITRSKYRIGVPYTAEDMPRSVFEAQWDIYSFPHGWLAWNEAVEAHAAAVIAHAEWVIAQAFYDANIGAYNAAMLLWWDLAYAWEDYYLLHDYWTFFPGDFPEGEPQPPEEELVPAPTPPPWPGSEPIVPADPGSWVGSAYNTCDDSDGPALVSSGSWIWGGDMGAPNADPVIFAKNPEQWSPWFDMPMPELPTPLSDAWDEDGNFKSDCINRDFLVCNMMTKCYNSTRMGVAPTIHPPIYIPPAV